MSKSNNQILILDDQKRWGGEFMLRLQQAGLNCIYHDDGEVVINEVEQDRRHRIKIILCDQLLYKNGDKNSGRQPFQGTAVRKKVYKLRPDIKYFVISEQPHLEFQKAIEAGDFNQAYQASSQWTQFSQEPNVIAIYDKKNLENIERGEQEYQDLIKKIRNELGEADLPSEPAIFIELGLKKEDYEKKIAKIVGISAQKSIRLSEYLQKLEEKQDKKDQSSLPKAVEQYLQRVLGQNVKQFLKTSLDKKDNLLAETEVVQIKVVSRKANSSRNLATRIVTGSSFFVILMILALRAEKGEKISIIEEDYIYKPRNKKDSGEELSEMGGYSLDQACSNPYNHLKDKDFEEKEDRYNNDNDDSLERENYNNDNDCDDYSESEDNWDDDYQEREKRKRFVNYDVAYGYDGDRQDKKTAKAIISKPNRNRPLASAICRFNEKGLGIIDPTEEYDKKYYLPRFETGIYLYGVDDE